MILIIAKDPEERRRALEGVLKKERAPIIFFESNHFESFRQEIETFPFLSKSKAVVLQEVDQLEKKMLDQLQAYVKKPNQWISLYLTAASLSAQSKLIKNIDTVIRIKEERPWEKEKRLIEWVIKEAANEGIVMRGPIAQNFVKTVDPRLFKKELEKLICYVGEKREISLDAVHSISTPIHHETLWQLGEAIFDRKLSLAIRIGKVLFEGEMAFFPLLAHLRTQFHTALKILTVFEQEGKAAVSTAFPYLRGGLLDKKIATARAYGKRRLKQGLVYLFETELKAKNGVVQPALLLEILLVKVTHDSFSTAECVRSC